MSRVREHAGYFSAKTTRTRRFYHSDWRKQAARPMDLGVVGGGCEWCAPDFIIERQAFPYVAFEFVLAGQGGLRLGAKDYDINAGMVFFFDSRVPHVIRSYVAEPLVKYFFNFFGSRIENLLDELKLKPGTVLRVNEFVRLTTLLDEAIDHALKGTVLGVRASAAALEYALVLCSEARQQAHVQFDPSSATYRRCRDFLLRNYPALSSVTELAKACHVSPAYLTRLFHRFDRETPHACLLRLKLNEALLKLQQPGALVKTVAADLGFKSAAHFSRAFRQYHGMAPRAAMVSSNPSGLFSERRKETAAKAA